jgi:hypothetical protein
VTTPVAPRLQLLSVPDCPLVDRARARAHLALAQCGIVAAVEECVGAYPSPTVLVDGRDVITAEPPPLQACCRLDLPAVQEIVAALTRTIST